MRVLGSLALLSAAFVQGEWTEDMGAELRMLQASNSSNSSSAGTTTGGSASNSSSAGTPGGSSSSGNTTTNPGTGSSSSGTSTSGNATTSTTTTSTTTTTTTTAAGNTTTTTTTTVAGKIDVVTSISFTVTNISAKLAANPTAKAAFKTGLGSAAVTEVCKVSLVSTWTQSGCEGDSTYAITVGDGTNAVAIRRQLGAHTGLDVVKTTVTSSIPASYETQVKTAVSQNTGTNSQFVSDFKTAAVAVVNSNAAALGMSNITTSDITVAVVAQSPPASSTTSGATSVSAFFAFAFASAAAALFMF